MSDIAGRMAEWRKTLWGAGPCPDSSRENFRLTDAERALLSRLGEDTREWDKYSNGRPWFVSVEDAATLRGLLERLGGGR